jgi:class 3 adenylate cyclase
MAEMSKIDARHLLAEIRCPTLVLQHRDAPYDGMAVARMLVSAIPDARLEVLDGNYGTGVAAERGPIAHFLGAPRLDPREDRLVTVMFTDMYESTRLTQRLGDERAQDLVRQHDAIVRAALKRHFGVEIKHTGDGIMASFIAPTRAVACAVEIQREAARHSEGAETPLHLRIGLNAGEPIVQDGDLFGSTVQLASRVCEEAQPGEIFATEEVRRLTIESGAMFADRGHVRLRGFDAPVHLFAVRWQIPG